MNKKLIRHIIVLTIVSVLFFFAGDNGLTVTKMQGYKALKAFAEASSSISGEFKVYETRNFTIKYTEADADIVGDLGNIFEKSLRVEGERYSYKPSRKMTVFLYSDQESFWEHQPVVKGQAVMGMYNLGVIHVLSPKAYLSKEQIKEKDFEKGGPILHEYVHSVIDEKTRGNLELWLTEGIALYEEYAVDGVEWSPGYIYESSFTADELRNNFAALEENQAYRQSFDIVKGLIDNYGKENLITLLGELKSGSPMEAAFRKVYGLGLDEYINSNGYIERP
ncbi:MAG: peptidase MA family metallohydrolase [Pseudomonadota bacterium]